MSSNKKFQPALAVGKSMSILARELQQDGFINPAALRAAEKAAQNAATAARAAVAVARLSAGMSLEEALQ